MTYERFRLAGTDPRPGLTADLSRGDLPPAESLQCEPEPSERIGWPETIGVGIFLILCAAMLAVI